jgi:uncharacterized membrane protein
VGIFSFLQKKPVEFFSEKENKLIVAAIRSAEQRTSGEVRVYVESKCRFMDALDRAVELFHDLKMHETADRNAVLVYVAMKDHQLAIYGDEGIHRKVGSEFWNEELRHMLKEFNKENYAEGIACVVREIGEVLVQHFPYDKKTDKNELPDDIVFGR